MYATLEHKIRTARKEHSCDYCGKIIKPGTPYMWSKNVYDDTIYEWHSHTECEFIVGQIWDYVDPDEGMSEEDFREACKDLSETFICPDCKKWDADNIECNDGEQYCLNKLYKFLQKNELYRADRGIDYCVWKSRPKEG